MYGDDSAKALNEVREQKSEEVEVTLPFEVNTETNCEEIHLIIPAHIETQHPRVDTDEADIVESMGTPMDNDHDVDNYISAEEDDDQESSRRYPLRNQKQKEFPDHVLYQATDMDQDPKTVQEALSRADGEKWRNAIQEELDSLKKNNTWTLVKPPKQCNIVDSKWLFRIKDEVGDNTRYKARLVARGFSQRWGIDYNETFSPVVRHSSLRLLIALAARTGLKVDQMDVKAAFLNGDISETIYMKQPDGFEEMGKENFVCRLNRSLYGLKQAARAWNQKLNRELFQIGFKQSKNEPCIYTRFKNGKIIILAVYVDDMLIFWNDYKELLKLKEELTSKFEMQDMGKADFILGMRISQSKDGIRVDQQKYIEKVLKTFGMEDCKVVATPSVPGEWHKLEKPKVGYQPDPRIPYQRLIGSLMYLAVCTRPDIANAVSYLSQFNTCYNEVHWSMAKRVLRYLKGTMSYGLLYTRKTKEHILQGYADASHAKYI